MLKVNTDWDIAQQERSSSKCIKGLVAIGMFAVAAGVVICAAASESELNLTP